MRTWLVVSGLCWAACHWFRSANANATMTVRARVLCPAGLAGEVVHTLDQELEAVYLGEVTWQAGNTCAFTPAAVELRYQP